MDKQLETIHAPKDEKTLEEISIARNNERKAAEALEEDEDKIKILDEPVSIDIDTVSLDVEPIQIDVEELK